MTKNYAPRYHYTYYSYEEFGRGYIGSRTTRFIPDKDTYYMGSYTDKTFHPTHKIILSLHDTAEESLAAEKALHEFYQVHINPHFANRARQTSKRFTTANRTWSDEVNKKKAVDMTPEEREKRRQGMLRTTGAMTPEERCEKWDRSGEDNPNYGNHLSEEAKESIRKAQTGRKHPPEREAKRHATRIRNGNNRRTEEQRKRMSRAQKGHLVSQAQREKISKARKGQKLSPEALEKRRQGMKERGTLGNQRDMERAVKAARKNALKAIEKANALLERAGLNIIQIPE